MFINILIYWYGEGLISLMLYLSSTIGTINFIGYIIIIHNSKTLQIEYLSILEFSNIMYDEQLPEAISLTWIRRLAALTSYFRETSKLSDNVKSRGKEQPEAVPTIGGFSGLRHYSYIMNNENGDTVLIPTFIILKVLIFIPLNYCLIFYS